jgi:hypothetical protein
MLSYFVHGAEVPKVVSRQIVSVMYRPITEAESRQNVEALRMRAFEIFNFKCSEHFICPDLLVEWSTRLTYTPRTRRVSADSNPASPHTKL